MARQNLMAMLRKILRTSRKPKTIVFAPLDSLGHINSLICIANDLKSKGHRTIFLFIEPIENKLRELGHEVYDSTTPDLTPSKPDDKAQDKWNEVIKICSHIWKLGDTSINIQHEYKEGFGVMIDDIKKYNTNIEAKIDLIKPDLFVIDHYFAVPALFRDSDIPWIRISSASPLNLHNESDLPQPWLGLPSKWNKSNTVHSEWNQIAYKAKKDMYDLYNQYWRSFGHSDLPTDPLGFIPVSPHLNIYMYPEELDYSEYPLTQWQRCDSMVREQSGDKFVLPEKLQNKPGKLIFLSLGSLASADTELMTRLTTILADSPHRYIVCKGPLHEKYELPDNMWGAKFVPQLQVLTSIDLIITHGGNNTITESFYFGVPGFIVCPLFGDQFDNAQRIHEIGLGIRLDPYNCTKEELLGAIQTMLSKADVKERMKAISVRMQKPDARNKAIKLVSNFVSRI